jgi:hypothetical protein
VVSILEKPLDMINEQDLRELVESQIPEHHQIEYKAVLPGRSDKERKEFLGDATSFANAAGGMIFYGIPELPEGGGLPDSRLTGIGLADPDQLILQLDHLLLGGVRPRMLGVRLRAIPLASGNFVVVLRVRQSLNPPHMVTLDKSQRFYARGSAGRHALDIDQLRDMFARSERGTDRIRDFRLARIAKVIAGDSPVPLGPDKPTLIVHLIPIGALSRELRFDADALRQHEQKLALLCGPCSCSSRLNLDGLVSYWAQVSGNGPSYVQAFRDGSIEAVDRYCFFHHDDSQRLAGQELEVAVMRATGGCIDYQKHLGVEVPIVVMVTVLGVSGWRMPFEMYSARRGDHAIDRSDLVVPEVILEDFESDIDVVLKPVFDAIWNAADRDGSPYYGEDGRHACRWALQR